MSNNETKTPSPNKSAKFFPAVLVVVGIIFFYNQYTEKQEKKLIESYTAVNVSDAMKKKIDLRPKVPVNQIEETKEIKAETPLETPPIESPTLITEKVGEIKTIEPKDKVPQPAVAEEPQKVEVKKVVEENVYTPPPSYNYSGKGLVYNCQGKHWACVDGLAYTTCARNMTWNKKVKRPLECVTMEVYASKSDCEVIQTQNVSQLTSTAFCLKEKKKKTKVKSSRIKT